ncbi:transcriptional regulatory protein DegU [Duganella sp. HH105]|nr:transcriptional regulatory protein DegU [Duganella sp. HH105]OFA02314.1 transcriptional regulatory protein DegU [Duganella sp. HH101]
MHAMKPTVLLIDDHSLFRAGLRLMLSGAIDHLDVREAASIDEALGIPRDSPAPCLVLLDIQLPGVNGLDGMTLIHRRWPDCPVIVLSADGASATAHSALARGAARFISKAEPAAAIEAAISAVLRGECDAPPAAADPRPHLTPRQCEVLALICEGLSNKLIARRLNLSENTVRGHVQALLAMLGVVSRAEAAFAARKRGLVG